MCRLEFSERLFIEEKTEDVKYRTWASAGHSQCLLLPLLWM